MVFVCDKITKVSLFIIRQTFIIPQDDDLVLISTNYSTLIEPGVDVPARVTPRKPGLNTVYSVQC